MSADILARAHALYAKAEELSNKGHLLRAAENYGRAAEAALALGADNLVSLHMQLMQGCSLFSHSVTAAETRSADPRTRAAHRAECIALHVRALEALERRRMAGTLLAGKCAAAKEAWFASKMQRENAGLAADEAHRLAVLVGYDRFVVASRNAWLVLSDARLFAAECSDAQFQFFAEYVVHTAELMMQQRGPCLMRTTCEIHFVNTFRASVARAIANGLDVRLVQLLMGTTVRLQLSGVQQMFGNLEAPNKMTETEARARTTAMRNSMTAPGLRRCALAGCGAKEAHPAHFKSCAACRAVVYCCREHQVAGWPSHKKACTAARKAAAADDAAGPSGA